jgi:hypothetical protein
MSTAQLERSVVERMVRQALGAKLLKPETAPAKTGVPPLVVNISARHCHVTQTDLVRLFGPGHQLTPAKQLYQTGFFAAEETVTIIGPRRRMICEFWARVAITVRSSWLSRMPFRWGSKFRSARAAIIAIHPAAGSWGLRVLSNCPQVLFVTSATFIWGRRMRPTLA